MSQITATWAISQTATDVVGVSKGILEAATSDNVQPIALLAGEKFGATLAISVESTRKVEMLCLQSHQSAIINTLKAYVGYKKGDSGWQLAQSDSGLRFLSLVACLLTIDHWTAAGALSELITSTAADRTLVPTSYQLKQLMHALDYKLACSGFADTVLGYGIWLDHQIQRVTISTASPSAKVVVQLVKAMSSLGRMGEVHKMYVQIPAGQAPWIIAFIKWCFGSPPSVVLGDRNLLAQDDSLVLVKLVAEPKNDDIEIVLLDELGDVSELVRSLPDGWRAVKGMISVTTYAQKILQYVGPESSIQYRACVEIIPYGCYVSLKSLQIKSEATAETAHFQSLPEDGAREFDAITGSLFPSKDEVSQTLAQFLGLGRPLALKPLPEGFQVETLPTVLAAHQLICSTCPCCKCLATCRIQKRKCDFELFLLHVSYCIVRVLIISLLVPGDPEGIQVRWKSLPPDISERSTLAVYKCLTQAESLPCSPAEFIAVVNKMLGHRISSNGSDAWIMSSNHGQTVYPQLLESRTIHKTGILRMICASGSLYYKGEPHNLVERAAVDSYLSDEDSSNSDEYEGADQQVSSEALEDIIRFPTDAYSNSRLIWQLRTLKDRMCLSVAATDLPSRPIRSPMRAVSAASQSLFVDCNHDRMSELSTHLESKWLRTVSPGRPFQRPSDEPVIRIVQSNGNELMRFFALTFGKPGVIREDSCLACCIQVCRLVNRQFIIC